jgi:hypothetical protein
VTDSQEQLDSLIKQSYRYAKWNGFAKVEDLSRLEFGVAKWIPGSIPPDVRAGRPQIVGGADECEPVLERSGGEGLEPL